MHHLYDQKSAVHMKPDSRLSGFQNDSIQIRLQTMDQVSLVTVELSSNNIFSKQRCILFEIQ